MNKLKVAVKVSRLYLDTIDELLEDGKIKPEEIRETVDFIHEKINEALNKKKESAKKWHSPTTKVIVSLLATNVKGERMKFIKREELKELIDIVFDIEETTEAQIFIRYCPHVDWVNVRVFKDGWNKELSIECTWGRNITSSELSFEELKQELLKYKKEAK